MNIISKKAERFSEMYSYYYPVVYNGIYAKIRNEDITGDLAQEIFVRFFEKMDEIENPRQWLFGALRFVLLEHYKKNRIDNVDIDDIFFDENLQYTNGFRDTRIILQEALDASENYRDDKEKIIYDLIAVRNFTYDEAAMLMGLTKTQIRYKYKCVVGRIVDYLKKKGVNKLEELL